METVQDALQKREYLRAVVLALRLGEIEVSLSLSLSLYIYIYIYPLIDLYDYLLYLSIFVPALVRLSNCHYSLLRSCYKLFSLCEVPCFNSVAGTVSKDSDLANNFPT